ncbi:hypothetical protein AB0H43_12765 [Hamadaea sp. NPDC050747]|uniref:DUF7455 domain-containing protein n=1 Tax=Hamadaea sp. NPDC050747 TaxID=3155789 RepID=UPI0033D9F369
MDMCDACHAAKAAHQVSKDGQELLFCGHHFKLHYEALKAAGWLGLLPNEEDVIKPRVVAVAG